MCHHLMIPSIFVATTLISTVLFFVFYFILTNELYTYVYFIQNAFSFFSCNIATANICLMRTTTTIARIMHPNENVFFLVYCISCSCALNMRVFIFGVMCARCTAMHSIINKYTHIKSSAGELSVSERESGRSYNQANE